MKKLAIIPARGGSKRIPDKNIVNFLGAPLMSYPLRAAQASGLFDVVHVSTDSDRIAKVAADYGCPVDFMRTPDLADDHTPLMPVMHWVTEQYAKLGKVFDSICLLYPTAPLIQADDLVRGSMMFDRHGGDRTVMAVSRFNVPIEWALHLADDGSLTALQPGMANVRSQDLRPAFYDAGLFSFIPAREIKVGAIDNARLIGIPVARHIAVDIDDQEDLELAEMLALGRRERATP